VKSVTSLVADVYATLEGKEPSGSFSSLDLTDALKKVYSKIGTTKERAAKTLHFSELGDPCPRKLNYRVNHGALAEEIDGNTRLKFFYGDMLEQLVLSVAEAAGHTVEKKQERAILNLSDGWQITGYIDAVVDGVLTDVKSTTKYGEEKFKNGLVDDPFGYKMQLGGYAVALDYDEAGFLTIQKELGHIGWYPIKIDKKMVVDNAEAAVEYVKRPLDQLPRLAPVPQSKTSKNMKLSTSCSYCSYKKECWPEMRTFLYSSGPEFLVEVVDLPRVVELKKDDGCVY
jgi:CRISPR/Cas system-associated exonuclease Cas4 (RecB family)